jgi:parallel beta-helix repeat protein
LKLITLLLFILLIFRLNCEVLGQESHSLPKEQLVTTMTAPLKLKIAKTSDFTPHAPIFINSNGEFISQGFSGSGTIDEPFLIEGYSITASSENLIRISGTTAYFRIMNNLLNGLNSDGVGIYCGSVINGEIANNTIYNMNGGIGIDESMRIEIVDNIISNNANGISITRGSDVTVFNNTITGNSDGGIWMGDSNYNTILNNSISNIGGNGFAISFSTNNIISNNVISSNDDSGIRLDPNGDSNFFTSNAIFGNNHFGISLGISSNNTITNNSFYDNGLGAINIGDRSKYNIVKTNTIHNNGLGIYLGGEGSAYNTISTNIVYFNDGYGIQINSKSRFNLVVLNNFTSNNLGGGGLSQANDDGNSNTFTHNFWNFWTVPDTNNDDFVDIPYAIEGNVVNNDSSPLVSSDQIFSTHLLLRLQILSPQKFEPDNYLIIQWITPFDSFDHEINYTIFYSLNNGDSWILLTSNITEISYNWDLSPIPKDAVVIFKIMAVCDLQTITVISNPYSLTTPLNWTILILGLVGVSLTIIIMIGSLIFWKRGYLFKKPTAPIETFTPSSSTTSSTAQNQVALDVPTTASASVTLDSASLQDLLRGRAISMDILTTEFSCSQLELPRRIKDAIGESTKGHLLVLRSGLILLEKIPLNKANCQICTRDFEGETYFQCLNCQRYVCTPHYVDLKAVGSTSCPNCGGTLMSLPFSCDGCSLDFSKVNDLTLKTTRCPLCGYSLVKQSKLIEERTKGIITSVQIPTPPEGYDEKKKSE